MRQLYSQASRYKRSIHCCTFRERRWCFLSFMYHFSKAKFLISKPYMNWKNMTIFPLMKLSNIIKLQWSVYSNLKTFYNSSSRIDHNVNEDSVERIKTIHSMLTAIMKSIEFCGRNGITVHGHQDNDILNSSDILKKS